MTENTTVKKAIDAENALQEKVALRYMILRKQMNRKDYIEAVEALDASQDEWSEIDQLIVFAHKADPSKSWGTYLDMSQEELEKVILGK